MLLSQSERHRMLQFRFRLPLQCKKCNLRYHSMLPIKWRTARISIADTLYSVCVKFCSTICDRENGVSLTWLNERKKRFLLLHARRSMETIRIYVPRLNPIPSHVASRGVHGALLTVNCLFNIPQNPRKRLPVWFTARWAPRSPPLPVDVHKGHLKILSDPKNVCVSNLRRRSFLQEINLMQPHGKFRSTLLFYSRYLNTWTSRGDRFQPLIFFAMQINPDK